MKLTGHKTEAVYRRYAIVSERDLAEGVLKLAALHRPPLPLEHPSAHAWRTSLTKRARRAGLYLHTRLTDDQSALLVWLAQPVEQEYPPPGDGDTCIQPT